MVPGPRLAIRPEAPLARPLPCRLHAAQATCCITIVSWSAAAAAPRQAPGWQPLATCLLAHCTACARCYRTPPSVRAHGAHLLHAAHDGTLGHLAQGLHVADGQAGLLAAVQELHAPHIIHSQPLPPLSFHCPMSAKRSGKATPGSRMNAGHSRAACRPAFPLPGRCTRPQRQPSAPSGACSGWGRGR